MVEPVDTPEEALAVANLRQLRASGLDPEREPLSRPGTRRQHLLNHAQSQETGNCARPHGQSLPQESDGDGGADHGKSASSLSN
jgi:hypothetical protein